MGVKHAVLVGAFLALSAPVALASAQGAGASRSVADSIPREFLPPADMCRIWLSGVPAQQQPAPTECSIAVRNKPPNGTVIYGPSKGGSSKPGLTNVPIKRFETPPGSATPVKIPGKPDEAAARREPWESKRISDEQLFGDRTGAQQLPGGAIPGAMSGQGTGGFEAYVGQGGLLLAPGQITDPRYFAGNTPPPGRGSSNCLDRDGDGWCDDFRFGPPPCLDRDRDGRCDDLPAFAAQAYPQVLPRMQSAVDVIQGRTSVEVAQWLGTNEFVARLPDQGRGTPWRAIFLDANTNQLLQVWTDRNKDGLVDRVEVFRDGQRSKLIQR